MRAMKWSSGLLTVTTAAMFSGCLVGPDYREPEAPVPSGFHEADVNLPLASGAERVDLEEWWKSFGDPALDSLLARGIASNLDVALAEGRIRQARAELSRVTSGLLPSVNLTGAATRTRTSYNVAQGGAQAGGAGVPTGDTTGTTTTSTTTTAVGQPPGSLLSLYRGGFDAAWELDLFGGGRRAREAAIDAVQASEEAKHAAMLTLLSEVALNYVQLRGLQHQMEIAEKNVRVGSDTLSLQQTKLDAGIASELSVSQIEAQLATIRAQIPTLRAQSEQAIHRIGILLGLPPGDLASDLRTIARIPSGPKEIPVGLPSELLRRRPDIRRAERQFAAATANIGVATSALFPRISLTGSLGLQSRDLDTFVKGSSFFWTGGPSLSWPIFQGGRILADIEIANAQQEQALAGYRQTVLTAFGEVEDSLVSYREEQNRLEQLRQAVHANQRSLELARQLSDAGVVEFLNVLSAEQSLFDAERQQAISEQTVALQLIALYKSLGGGWSSAEALRETVTDAPESGKP